jgi:nicotinate-nucleotide adenylyltransferase
MMRQKRRIAFFGGTFDPFHNGHLEMAKAASEWLGLHSVYFVPAAQNPLKGRPPVASAEQRLEMIQRGIEGYRNFGTWAGELGREGPSYTLDSIEHIERVYPNSYHFWIIGSDQLPQLSQWYGIEKLTEKIGFILVQRPGFEWIGPGGPGLSIYPVENPLMPVSATEIRGRAAKGLSLSGLVPPKVETFIQQEGLYR